MNFEQARFNMIEQQIRPWDVLDQKVLDLIGRIHREDFIPEEYRQLALADTQLPLPHGQYTMTPKLEARLLQVLDVRKDDKVLEIGTGCAYLTALLAASAKHVTSVDIYPDFTEQAAKKLARYDLHNVTLETGDALRGWSKGGPYDVIAVTGSLPMLDPCFQEQLNEGGRLFVIVGASPVMEAILITRFGTEEWSRETLFETDLPALAGAPAPVTFTF
jgi:protein-L-isoaspartate(D-aspartate) O-methyltransferase